MKAPLRSITKVDVVDRAFASAWKLTLECGHIIVTPIKPYRRMRCWACNAKETKP